MREFVAAHCGLNPNIAGPLDPNADIVAERDRLRAKVATLTSERDAARAQLADAIQAARNAGKPSETRPKVQSKAGEFDRKAYQRDYMRLKRAKKAKQS